MEEELKSLKQALLSLVVSKPTTSTVNSLLKDYRNLVGCYLPLAKFGYKDPVTFLTERCTDVFVVEGPSWDPILTPKITKRLQHVDNMVQKQKIQSSVKFKGKRKSVPGTNIMAQPFTTNPHNLVTNTFNKRSDLLDRNNAKRQVFRETNVVAPIQITEPRMLHKLNHPEPPIVKKETDYTSKLNENINNQSYNNDKSKHQDKLMTNSNINKENLNSNMEENRPSSGLGKIYKRLPQYTSNSDFAGCDRASKTSDDSGRQSLSSLGSTSKQARLDDLREEILTLITGSGGVWCTDLMRLYKERYDRELNYSRFGYTSIISLVYSMEDRVFITRPVADGDWFLQDPSMAASTVGMARAVPVPAVRRPAQYLSCRELDEKREEALPGVEFEPGVYPADCVHYVDAIPPAPISDLRTGDRLEVMVGEVYSPSHFWLIRVGEQYNLAMEAVMDEMTEYYRGEGASRVLSRGAVRVGQYCAAEYDRDWHRSVIVAVVDCDVVKVRHVDYGTVESVPVSALKPLLRRWAELPAQAIRGRLASVRPTAAGRRWPRAACTWLLQCVRDTRLYANIRAVDTEEDIVETFLIDTRTADDLCLTRELIRAGHADRRPDSALNSGDCYLYPRFSALETGATPNYAEISRYLADGIALEYVAEYRRHVPCALDSGDPHPHHAPSPVALPRPHEFLTRVPLLRAEPTAAAPVPAPSPSPPSFDPPPPPPPAIHDEVIPSPPSFSSPAPSVEPAPFMIAQPGADQARGVVLQLSESEWTVLTHLRETDSEAAHWYLMTAAFRALALRPPSTSSPQPH